MRRIALGSLLVAFALLAVAFAGRTAHAQPLPRINPQPSLVDAIAIEEVSDVLVGTAAGRWNLRYAPNLSGPVTGTIRFGAAVTGDRLEGYRTLDKQTKEQSLALVQFKRNAQNVEVMTNVYTADKNPTQRSWMGASYALDVPLGSASAARNATAFRTAGPFGRLCDPACVARNSVLRPLPVVASPIAIDAAAMAGFGIDAGGQRGPLVLRAGAGGNNEGVLSGHVLGDALKGHYARGAGTIAVLRLRNGQPIQVFVGVLDGGGVKGGRGYPLVGIGGNPFAWNITTNDQVVSGLRSLHARNRCLTPDNPASGPGGVLTTTTTCTGNVNVSWVVFAMGANGGRTLYSLVSVATGLCLEMPGTRGADVFHQICNGAPRQLMQINEFQQVDANGVPIANAVPLNTTAAFGSSSFVLHLFAGSTPASECLGIVGSTGAVVEQSCTDSKVNWTHNP